MSPSRLEKVKSSIFRSKSDSPSPHRAGRPFSRILSPAKSKQDSASTPQSPTTVPDPPPTAAPRASGSVTQLPLNPRTSPASNYDSIFDQSVFPRTSDARPPSRELRHEDPPSDGAMTTDPPQDDHMYSDTSEMDERYMKRKLMDMESSFLPDFPLPDSPRSMSSSNLHHHSSSPTRHRISNRTSPADSAFLESTSMKPSNISVTPAEYFHTPATRQTYRISEEKSEDLDISSNHPAVSHSLSSPSAAAAQRSKLRAAAGFTPLRNATTLALTHAGDADKFHSRASDESQERPSSAPQEYLSASDAPEYSQPTHDAAEFTENDNTRKSQSSDVVHQSSEHQDPPMNERPGYLKARQTSQRSSASSYLSREGGSDFTGAGSGGATPASHSTVRQGTELSRLPSLGSVASTMSINTARSTSHRQQRQVSSNAALQQDKNLSPVAEHRSGSAPTPQTPYVTVNSVPDPRDTVVARNVRDVEVPATVARHYREAQGFGSTNKSFASPNFSRNKGDLTLKEQNSRIDKLSKENFDLKLKIHYLYQALQDRSDEGVRDLISKNAQLSTDIIKVRKENQGLRRRVKQLERDVRAREDGASAIRTVSESEDVASSRSWQQAQLEDEIAYLRDRMQAIEEDNERLRKGDVARELEKRRMADQVKSIAGGDHTMWFKDELDQEKSKRERVEREALQLRLELSRVKSERSPAHWSRLQPGDREASESSHSISKPATPQDASSLSGSTVVEQLRQENADLRRDLGAQTSMLTSRNRERERLQQEIEDLKLVQRRGDGLQTQGLSVAGDSLLDRSVSRNHLRPTSRASTQKSDQLSESEKDKYETKQAALRDENSALRMRNQDLQSELDMLTGSAEHLESLRRERDDALILIEEERDFAADAIDRLEEQMERKDKDINQLLAELRAKEDESQALEKEISEISTSLSRLADESEGSYAMVQDLRQELTVTNGELEAAQQNLQDAMAAKERLEVQAESSQSEIAFLREEQESDKIKISDLHSALARAKTNLRDEKERLREFEEMEAETKRARDEARRLKKALSAKEDEVARHRENLDEVSDSLRKAISSSEGSLPILIKSVGRLRRDLELSQADLQQSNGSLEEKHQRLQDHIMLLESSEADRHRLVALLEKERQGWRQERVEFDRVRQSPTGRNRIGELEQAHAHDQQRLDEMQQEYGEALGERDQLLYDLWTRLSTLCGPEWLGNFPTATKEELPSLESIKNNVSSVEVPLSLALDTIAQTLSTFRTRIRSTEKDLYKDLEILSHDLDERSKRIDELERNVTSRGEIAGDGSAEASADIARLKHENHLLRRELKILKKGAFALPGLPSPQLELENAVQEAALVEHERQRIGSGTSRSGSGPTAHRSRHHQGPARENDNSALQQQPPASTHTATEATDSEYGGSASVASVNGNHSHLALNEQRWLLRLQELERKLIAEREGRVLDREGARQRLRERDNHIGGLKKRLDVEKGRRAFDQSRQGAGPSTQETPPESR